MKKIRRHLLLPLLALPLAIGAQDVYKEHLDRMFQHAERRFAFEKTNPKKWKKWQTQLRAALSEKLGLNVLQAQYADYVPTAKLRSTEDVGYAILDRWVLYTEPDMPLPIVVLRPKNLSGKVPLMITPHGHGKNTESYAGVYWNEEERFEGEDEERNVGVQAAQHGFIAIVPTARAFGETRSAAGKEKDITSSCSELMLHDALFGRSPVGDRVWDIMKIIDWALKELPVDGKNIIVSGNSGGGTATFYAGAIDERISMSLPASAFCQYSPSIGHIVHCACNYIPGVMQLGDMGDLGGLTAPRCFCAIQGVSDPIFPIEGAREAFATVQKVYEAAGVPENCELYEGPGGHRYYKAGAWDFILKHLKK